MCLTVVVDLIKEAISHQVVPLIAVIITSQFMVIQGQIIIYDLKYQATAPYLENRNIPWKRIEWVELGIGIGDELSS